MKLNASLIIFSILVLLLGCNGSENQKQNPLVDKRNAQFEAFPKIIDATGEAVNTLKGWPAYTDFNVLMKDLSKLKSREASELILDRLLESEKALVASKIPAGYKGDPQIESRLNVVRSWLLRARFRVSDSSLSNAGMQEFIVDILVAYNNLNKQFTESHASGLHDSLKINFSSLEKK